MNRNAAILQGWQTATTILSLISKRCRVVPVVALLAIAPAIAQNSEMQEKLAAVKAVAAENKQQLCQYGSDGQVQKTPIGAPPPEPSGGRLKQKIIAKKKAEIKGYMEQVKALLSIYVPPDPQRMQEAYQAGKFSLNPMPGVLRLVFTDYAQPGDRMSIAFDTTAKKITLLDVDTYLDEEKHAVTLHVQMATLPNGPNYAQKTVLNASAKELVVTTTNYSYQKLGGQ